MFGRAGTSDVTSRSILADHRVAFCEHFRVPIKFPLFLTFTGISEFRIWTIAYLPSTENASKTFPGIPPQIAYPEFTKSIPSAIAAPAPSSEPPLASTPLTVL
jgi:hypothetical protein